MKSEKCHFFIKRKRKKRKKLLDIDRALEGDRRTVLNLDGAIALDGGVAGKHMAVPLDNKCGSDT